MAAAQLGLKQEAGAAVARVLAIDPAFADRIVDHLRMRNVHADLIPVIVDGLRKAGLPVREKAIAKRL